MLSKKASQGDERIVGSKEKVCLCKDMAYTS